MLSSNIPIRVKHFLHESACCEHSKLACSDRTRVADDAATLLECFFSIKIADEDEHEFEKSIDNETEYIYETYYETYGDISESTNSG